eukprot:Gb_30041 [translate_table: standard]
MKAKGAETLPAMSASRSSRRKELRCPLQEHSASKTTLIRHRSDRFIPDRGSMDFDVARYLLSEKEKEKENNAYDTPSKESYRTELAATLLKDSNNTHNKSRILSFQNKPPAPPEDLQFFYFENSSAPLSKSSKSKRYISQSAERTLDAPDLVDDYYLNLLDWSVSNVLSIALGNTVYLWDASNSSTSELLSVDDDEGPVTSVNWAPDGRHIAVGLTNSVLQLWDYASNRQLRALRGHRARVGALAWNGPILTTGGLDGLIFNHDVRIRDSIIEIYRGHEQEVCGLKWSLSGQQLASGGNDNLLHIWDRNMASSNTASEYLHRIDGHRAAVKALAWCPFQSNLLASGGGSADRCIKFWNTHTGACLNTIDTNSQVCALMWNKHERELLSSHGFSQNQLTLWKYPSMGRIAELTGHTSRVLHLAQSPDGYTVASAAGDETLRFWQVFGTPDTLKRAKTKDEPGAFNKYLTYILAVTKIYFTYVDLVEMPNFGTLLECSNWHSPDGGTLLHRLQEMKHLGFGKYLPFKRTKLMRKELSKTAQLIGCTSGVLHLGQSLLITPLHQLQERRHLGTTDKLRRSSFQKDFPVCPSLAIGGTTIYFTSSNPGSQHHQPLDEHHAAVKALRHCPSHSDLLPSGGGIKPVDFMDYSSIARIPQLTGNKAASGTSVQCC